MMKMVDSIGQKLLAPDKYKRIITSQNESLIDFYIELLEVNLIFIGSVSGYSDKITKVLMDTFFGAKIISAYNSQDSYVKCMDVIDLLNSELQSIDTRLMIEVGNSHDVIYKYVHTIYPVISSDEELMMTFRRYLEGMITRITSAGPC